MFSIIMYSTAALLILPAVLLLSGRGAFLIAGYNTAAPEKKAAYDEKKLCRVTGGGLLLCGILLLLWAIIGEDAPPWFVAVLTIVTLLDKPSRRAKAVTADLAGFVVPDEFVVGYGLDYCQKYRNLPYIGVLKPEVYSK